MWKIKDDKPPKLRTYPLFKQCDPRWTDDKVGSGGRTMCQAGCAVTCLAMALSGIGQDYTPRTLNKWLKDNGGYDGDAIIWGSVRSLGLKYQGKIASSQVATQLKAGKVVICSVNNRKHWVLVTGVSGDTIQVNDPGYKITSYQLSQTVSGNHVVYSVE